MSAKNQYDYDALKVELIKALRNGLPARWQDLAKHANIDIGTLRSAAKREWGITDPRHLAATSLLNEPPPDRIGTDVKEGANILEVSHVSGLICTLEEALKASKTDLNEWQVRDHQINFWPLGMKVKDDKGVERPYAMQLCQVRVWLIRKHLKPIMPMIRPVEVIVGADGHPPRPSPRRGKNPVRRALFIADPQVGFRRVINTGQLIPFHDRRVLDIALQISRLESFDSLEIIGDCLDLSAWSSKFNPEPEFYWTTQPALIEWAWWLGQFSHIRQKRMLEGNHEKRMRDLVAVYAKEAYGLRAVDELELPPSLSVDRLMAFHKLGVEYITGYPDNKYWLNKNVLVRHGDVVRAGPGDTAKAVVNKTTYTTIFGHIHRRELVSRRIQSREGDVIQTAFCPGCACHVDGRVPGSKSDDQWQQGIAVIEHTDDAETILPIPIENGRAIYKGQLLTANERDDEINKMFTKTLGAP